jgi:sialidase-1
MKGFKFKILSCLVFVVLNSFECSKTTAALPPAAISVNSHAPFIPIVKGLTANPFLRVMVGIPSGNAEQQYRKLQCTLNSYSDIDKINVYLTGAEPFSTTNLITSFQPSSNSFDVPVTLDWQAGVYFIWFSVVLKSDASIDHKIEFHCQQIVDVNGKVTTIPEDNSAYVKRIGVSVRKAGDDGINTYRIPGIMQTDKGTLISVYDIRYNNSNDLPGYINIGMSRSNDKGSSWQPMKTIMSMGGPNDNSGVGDPSILFDETTKTIWVAALWSKGNRSIAGSIGGISPDSTGQFLLVKSSDDGSTWSSPINITPQIKDPAWKILFQGPGRGIMMQDGKLVFPAQYWNASNVPYSTIVYSEDHGTTWKGKITGPKSNTTESQVVETTTGTLMLNMRDNRGSFRSVATTNNMGGYWTEHPSSYSALPDPVCMGSLIKANVKVNGALKDILFFSNPATMSGRYNISIKGSLDLGQAWLPANQLLIDERQCYGYSCLTKVDDNNIGILYEGVKDLYFVKVPVSDIVR